MSVLSRRQFLKASLLLAGSVFVTRRALAVETPSEAQKESFKQKWEKLSEEEKTALRERYARFKSLPPERQKRILERAQKWKSLPEEDRARVRKNFQRWKSMNPEQRKDFRRKIQKYRSLPLEKRIRMREQFKKRQQRKRLRG